MLRPDLYLNPVDRFFMTEFDSRTIQDPKSLTPSVFAEGISKAELVRALQQFGYIEDRGHEVGPDEVWFQKNGPIAIVCGQTFEVTAKFGADGLTQALANRWASCL